jgi:hypothetical protein
MAYAENAEDGTELMFAAWELYGDDLTWTLEATTQSVGPKGVVFTTKDGKAHHLDADSVVISGGMRPLTEEALAYSGHSVQFMAIGDCEKPANLQVNLRKAFGATAQI